MLGFIIGFSIVIFVVGTIAIIKRAKIKYKKNVKEKEVS